MTAREKWLIAAIVAGVLAFCGVEWRQDHEARAQAESKIAALQPAVDAAKSDSAAKQKQIDDNNAKSAAREAAIDRQSAQIYTTLQALAVINRNQPQAQPGAPSTAGVSAQKSDLSAAVQKELPDAPSYSIFTQDQTVAIAKGQESCAKTQDALGNCQTNLALQAGQLGDAKTALAGTTKQRDDAQAALKGGTFFQRVRHAGECLLTSSVGAAAGAALDKKHPGSGAAIGGAAGAATCSVWRW